MTSPKDFGKDFSQFIALQAQKKPERVSLVARYEALSKLPRMPQFDILCGKNGGLPFEYLMTDVVSGCLSAQSICYGNCSAAEHWFECGYDFGKRVLNRFDTKTFLESAKKLPKNQRWLRQGWAADCSFSKESWNLVQKSAEILADVDVSLLIITKAYRQPEISILKTLAQTNTELRVSLSAFDTIPQLRQRLGLLERFKDLGGKAVPYLMSARYSDDQLSNNQNALVDWITVGDYIAAEHPIRLNNDNSALSLLEKDGFYHPKFPDQYWFGRLFSAHKAFRLPPPTHLCPEYTLSFTSLSAAQGKTILGLDGNLPTYEQLKSGYQEFSENLHKHATYEVSQK